MDFKQEPTFGRVVQDCVATKAQSLLTVSEGTILRIWGADDEMYHCGYDPTVPPNKQDMLNILRSRMIVVSHEDLRMYVAERRLSVRATFPTTKTAQADYIMPTPGSVWKHYKGKHYSVTSLAINERGELAVVYKSNDLVDPVNYVQPLARFLGYTEDHKKRMMFVGPSNEGAGR